MNAEELIRVGRLDEALASLQSQVRSNPEDPKLRTFLFQLFCLLGQWERALTQLKVLADMGPETMMLARIFEPVIGCELLRGEIFSGKRTPIIFGQPTEWVGWLVQANELAAKLDFKAAQQLRDRAFESAPATAGKLQLRDNPAEAAPKNSGSDSEKLFEWIADADVRLGPLLETIVEGHYYWIPFHRIKRIYIEPPTDLRDLVWAPAQFVWANGGEAAGHIPARYPNTEDAKDDQLRLGHKTEWVEREGGLATGLGQRLLATNDAEYSLLQCRTIDLVTSE